MVYTIRPSGEEWRADFMRVLRRFISERRARRSGVKDNVGIVSARLDSMSSLLAALQDRLSSFTSLLEKSYQSLVVY